MVLIRKVFSAFFLDLVYRRDAYRLLLTSRKKKWVQKEGTLEERQLKKEIKEMQQKRNYRVLDASICLVQLWNEYDLFAEHFLGCKSNRKIWKENGSVVEFDEGIWFTYESSWYAEKLDCTFAVITEILRLKIGTVKK